MPPLQRDDTARRSAPANAYAASRRRETSSQSMFSKKRLIARALRSTLVSADIQQDTVMSKGLDKKREQKKKPAKTLEEKRAAKKAKKAGRSPMPGP